MVSNVPKAMRLFKPAQNPYSFRTFLTALETISSLQHKYLGKRKRLANLRRSPHQYRFRPPAPHPASHPEQRKKPGRTDRAFHAILN